MILFLIINISTIYNKYNNVIMKLNHEILKNISCNNETNSFVI